MLLMIDNYDSFTYTLVNYLEALGEKVAVVENDRYFVSELAAMNPTRLMISPGPCTPNEAGVSLAAIEYFAGKIPILGVCLGHQAIGQVFGAAVVKAKQVMHGKTSPIFHRHQGVFAQLPVPFTATRYHSLVLQPDSIPPSLEVTAWTQNEVGELDEVMAVRHREWAIEGVQFHPESELSEHGYLLLENFLRR